MMSNRKQILKHCLGALGLAVLFLAPSGAVYALTCTSNASGNWNAAIWTGCTAPVAADDVVIAPGHTVTVNVPAACNSLSMTGASTSALVIGAGQSLSVTGAATVNASSVGNGQSNSIVVGTGTLSIGGNLTLTGGNGNRNAILSMSDGSVTVGGSISGVNASSLITFTGAGTLNIVGDFATGATLAPGTGSVIYNGAGAQSVGAYTYNNLTIGKSAGTATLSGNAPVVSNLNISGGILNLSGSSVDRTAVGGTISVANGAALMITGNKTFPANYATHTLGPTSTVDYAGASQIATNEAYGHLQLSGTGTTITPSTAMTVAGDLTLSGTATADVRAAITVNGNLTIGAGTTFLASSFTHNIKGNFSGGGTLTPGSSTFNFNGASAQAIAGPASFFNLTLNNASGMTASGVITVLGNFTHTAGFAAGTSNVTFGGSAASSLTGATTFHDLTMNNLAGLTLDNTVTVSNTLTLASGNITTGANALVMPSGATVVRSSGHIVGNLTKHFAIGSQILQNFEIGTGVDYAPVAVTAYSVSVAGNMTAKTTIPDHPQLVTSLINPTYSVNRYWTLSKDGALIFDSIGAVFNFVLADIDSGSNTDNFIVQRYVAPSWLNTTLVSPLPTSTEAGNIIALGDFAVGQTSLIGFSHEKEFVFTRELY